MTLALSGAKSLRELTEIADKIVKEQLERSQRRGRGGIVGGAERSDQRLGRRRQAGGYNLPITAVRDAIVAAERRSARRKRHRRPRRNRPCARSAGSRTRQFNDLVVTTLNGTPIRIRDVGHAEDGKKERRSIARLNGVPTVSLEIQPPDGREHRRGDRGRQGRSSPGVVAQLPADVKLEVIRDQSRYIYAALHEINVHLVLGSIFACLVVLAFMRTWRSTIIAGVAIPASVIATFGMMWALDFTLNSVTMLALVLMVGIVIDDAIVVLENIFRFVEEKKMRADARPPAKRRRRSGWPCWRRRSAWSSSSSPSRSCRASPGGSCTSSASPRRSR